MDSTPRLCSGQASSPQVVILTGIDEAGFGPILGPLVVSSSTFSIPHHLINADSTPRLCSGQAGSPQADLWQVLKKSAANKRKHLAGRLLIADSKKAHNKSLGIKHLQRTVLACLKCLGKEPATLAELLQLLCPDYLEQLNEYPWYKKVDSQMLSACGEHVESTDKADIALASQVLSDDLSSNGIKLLELKSRCLDVAYYNKMVTAVKNKANVLFTATSQLIKNAFDNFADDELQIIIDRQGGRVKYRKALQLMFPDMELKIINESQNSSSYELQANAPASCFRKKAAGVLHFVVGADDRYLPVSLASMVSKYLRELLVYNINRYFTSFGADLKPTAGYWKDGLRFIKDIKTNLPHVKYDENQLIRLR